MSIDERNQSTLGNEPQHVGQKPKKNPKRSRQQSQSGDMAKQQGGVNYNPARPGEASHAGESKDPKQF